MPPPGFIIKVKEGDGVKTVIYADVLVAVNIYVTYFLIVAARLILKVKTKGACVALAAVAGGLSSLFVLADFKGALLQIVSKLFFGAVITFVAFLPKSVKRFFKCLFAFFCVSFVFGGVMLFFEYVFHPAGFVFINGTVYFDVSVLFIAVMSIVCYGAVLCFDKLFKRRAAEKTLYTLKIYFRGQSCELFALYDTGNNLTDGIEGRPVIIADVSSLKRLFNSEEYEFLKNADFSETLPRSLSTRLRLVAGKSVCGNSLFWAFLPEKLYISDKDTSCVTDFAAIAVTNSAFSESEYSAILNSAIFERSKKTNEIKL